MGAAAITYAIGRAVGGAVGSPRRTAASPEISELSRSGCVVAANHDHRAVRVSGAMLTDRPEQQAGEAAVPA